MRVGILTTHYSLNYGAILQSIATAQLFNGEIIDHRNRHKCRAYDTSSGRRAHLKEFIDNSLPLSSTQFLVTNFMAKETWQYAEREYDLLVCGSDELWKTDYRPRRPLRHLPTALLHTPVRTFTDYAWRQTNRYAPPFPNVYWPQVNIPCIAFATSIGDTCVEDIPARHLALMADRLDRFSLLGVRDTRTEDFVRQLLPERGDEIEWVPDPVFAWDPPEDLGSSARRVLQQHGVDTDHPFCFLHVRPLERRAACRRQMEQAGLQVADLLEMPLSPPEWYAAIGLAACGVTMAMHPLICSIVHDVPCFSFDPRKKSVELRQQFGLAGFRDLEQCRSNWPSDIPAKVADYRQRVQRFVGKAKEHARLTPVAERSAVASLPTTPSKVSVADEVAKSDLLVTTGMSDKLIAEVAGRLDDRPVSVLDLSGSESAGELPNGWRRLDPREFLDTEAVRREFLEFLNTWPRQPLLDGKSFDELFRRDRGYSLWWTSIGMLRIPNPTGIFRNLRSVWMFDRVVRAMAPPRVFLCVGDEELAGAMASRLDNSGAECEFLEGSARPPAHLWRGGFARLAGPLLRLPVLPIRMLLTALLARLCGPRPQVSKTERSRPAIVFLSRATRTVRVDQGRVDFWGWRELCQNIADTDGDLRQFFMIHKWGDLPGYKKVAGIYNTIWPRLRKSHGDILLRHRHPALGAWARSLPTFVANLWRYYRLEKTAAYRNSFRFAGADVSPIVVPRIRTAISGFIYWAQLVGATAKCLQSVGNVKAVLVSEGLYPIGTRDVAAIRELGVPAIGVQHGAIMPSHLVYRLPPEHAAHGVIPDYYAVFGEFPKQVMAEQGSYPAERVWVTGCAGWTISRYRPKRKLARRVLQLPLDKVVIVVATQTYPWFKEVLKAIFEVISDRDDCVVCIKKHPKRTAMSLDEISVIADAAGARNVQYFNDQLEELLAACDVLISSSSTTILEATLLGHKSICVNFSGEPDDYPYVDEGVSLPAKTTSELREALDRAMSPAETEAIAVRREAFLRRHLGPTTSGKAAECLAHKVLSLCDASPDDREAARRVPGRDPHLASPSRTNSVGSPVAD